FCIATGVCVARGVSRILLIAAAGVLPNSGICLHAGVRGGLTVCSTVSVLSLSGIIAFIRVRWVFDIVSVRLLRASVGIGRAGVGVGRVGGPKLVDPDIIHIHAGGHICHEIPLVIA